MNHRGLRAISFVGIALALALIGAACSSDVQPTPTSAVQTPTPTAATQAPATATPPSEATPLATFTPWPTLPPTPPPTPYHTPGKTAAGVVIALDASAGEVTSFTLRTTDGQVVPFAIGVLETDGAAFISPCRRFRRMRR